MKSLLSSLLFFALGALGALAGIVAAQEPTRVRGTISAADGGSITVKSRDGQNVVIRLAEKTAIVFTQPIALADIKPGDFLAITSAKRADGSLTALEVRRFPKPLNPGHRPFDGRDDQTMTNATVGAMVQSASGRELTMTYDGGSQKIVVPENASISTLVPGNGSQLVPGADVNLTARAHDGGKLTALRIQVSPPK
jgi:outer membrane lipoprotein SlyB